ncbi:hypothetical protein GCM10009827_102090 [Dactylosporangium maewongense]|uniref:Uncharacterized protein n=1 Tax=Dactylosporangium maewongense TaxID=634393 RepID=A0ABN2CXG4_9ACTN
MDGGVRGGAGAVRADDADAGQAEQDGGEADHGTAPEQSGWSSHATLPLSNGPAAPSPEAPILPSAPGART